LIASVEEQNAEHSLVEALVVLLPNKLAT